MDFFKKRIDRVLIICGAILFLVFALVTQINNIPTYNNIVGVIGALTLLPIFIGLFIRGKQKKNFRLIWISIIFFVALIIGSIIVLINM